MNRVELGKYGNQTFRRAIRRARYREDSCLARGDFARGLCNRLGMRKGNDDRAVAIGMNQIAVTHRHAEYTDLIAERDGLGVRVRRCDVPREKLKTGRPLIEVADGAVRDQPERAQSDVNGGLYFSPKRATASVGAL